MNISLGHGTATHGLFTVESVEQFSWDSGKEFDEKNLDTEIEKFNKKADEYNKKYHKKTNSIYQYFRDGKIEKVSMGFKEPTYFMDKWICAYRYRAQQGTTEKYLSGLWWHK